MTDSEQLSYLRKMVKDADTPTLLMSRMNCHAAHVSSIVVKNENGRLLRAFLAWPRHRLWTNHLFGQLAVGIHDHRYAINLQLIAGNVCNRRFQECNYGYSRTLYKWKFSTGVESGKPTLARNESGRLTEIHHKCLTDEWTYLAHNDLHTIDSNSVAAAWWVQEGETKQESTRLYTPTNDAKCDGLYDTFETRESVIEHVSEFCKLFGN